MTFSRAAGVLPIEPRPWVVAHRGEALLAPENTMAAFALARESGADAIELDVQLSSDGLPVVIHDTYLERTTNGIGAVRNLPWKELSRLDASGGCPHHRRERIPLLEEILDWAADVGMPLLVELRTHPFRDRDVASAIARILEPKRDRHVIVYSSDHDVITELGKRLDWLHLGVILNERGPSGPACLMSSGARLLSQSASILTPDSVTAIHQMGGVVSSAVRHRQDLDMLLSWGVDLLVSDHITVASLREAIDHQRETEDSAAC